MIEHNVRGDVQLILKSKTSCALGVQWVALRGPWGEARLGAAVRAHSFHEDAPDAAPAPLPLADRGDTNRLLSNKAIHFRYLATIPLCSTNTPITSVYAACSQPRLII
ncbi:hypothetical protein HF086_006200 [Spodoptera exigua]|uniref:Uncharacterized protein n=1 Tax=Spodoptera exigua TaxID=7107 RepID=A0A922MDU9_SPOEX|nr:hypothetical protein HF086_006200 [Spodoptera exigua]